MTQNPTTLEILENARELISDKKNWIKGREYRKAEVTWKETRKGFIFTRTIKKTEKVDQFCMIGAIKHATVALKGHRGDCADAMFIVDQQLASGYGFGNQDLGFIVTGCYDIPSFNDSPGTTHENVLAVMDRAISAERQRIAKQVHEEALKEKNKEETNRKLRDFLDTVPVENNIAQHIHDKVPAEV